MEAGETFDYVIAGGGSAACLLAARLIEQGSSVCIVEAGKESSGFGLRIPAGWMWTLEDPAQTWRHQTEGGPHIDGRSILIRQGRVTGGTGAMNGLVYVRGQAADYDSWRDSGLPGWGWHDVRPFFEKLEHYEGTHPGQRGQHGEMGITDNDWRSRAGEAFIAAANQVGIPRNNAPNVGENEGVGYYERMISRGWRSAGSYITFLRKYRRHPSLKILSEHIVDSVDIQDRRAVGLTVRSKADPAGRRIAARDEVILASSTFGNPGILLRSGIGAPEALAAAGIVPTHVLPGVGRNLQDHFSIRLIARTQDLETLNSLGRAPRLWLEAARWLIGQPSIVATSPALIYAFFRALTTSRRADATIFFTPGMQGAGGKGLAREAGITCGIYPLRPDSRGDVRIGSSDPFAMPIVQPNYLAAETDQRVTIAALRKAREIFAAAPLARHITSEAVPGSDVESDDQILAFCRATGVTSHHPVGTARMGAAGDQDAVVDHELRVRGLAGLRIADASVIPLMPSGNTLAPTLMIAERAAAFLQAARKLNS